MDEEVYDMLNRRSHAFAHDDAFHEDAVPASELIVEFVLPGVGLGAGSGAAREQLGLVLPVLGHLSRSGDHRWLCCIGSPLLLTKRDCPQYGIDWQRVLQVLPSPRCDVLDIAERALQAGRSHTVVFVVDAALTPQQTARLDQAAQSGGCRCIVIRGR
jgi:cell division inhibitor SulA